MSEALTVVFALFPGITQLDFTAPAQALSRMPGARLAARGRSGKTRSHRNR